MESGSNQIKVIAFASRLTALSFYSTHLANDYGLPCDISDIVFNSLPFCIVLSDFCHEMLFQRGPNGVSFMF